MTHSDFGITVTLPDGWYGEIFRTLYNDVTETGPVVHAANTPIILGDRSGYAPEARRLLRDTDAILCIVNQPSLPNILAVEGTTRLGFGQQWTLAGADSTPFTGVPMTQSSLRKPIQVGERVFDMIAFFGSRNPAPAVVDSVERVVNTVRIDREPPVPGNRIEQFFSIKDAIAIQEWARAELAQR